MAPRSRQQNIISLCAGVGGLDLGVHDALADLGFAPRTVLYLEREVQAAAVLVSRMQDGLLDDAPVWSDLESFDGEPWCGLVDGVIGGVPCQPHSNAGKRGGIEDSRWLWPDVLRILEETGAWWFLLENVDGLRTSNDGEALGKILQGLASRGFVFAWLVLSAADIGAPHRRNRLFLLAVKMEHANPAERSVLRSSRLQHSERTARGHDADGPSRAAGPLADSRCDAGPSEKAIPQRRARRTASARAGATADGVGQADAISPGLEGRAGEPGDARAQQAAVERVRGQLVRPKWPPGPDDIKAWDKLIDIFPDLAPAIKEVERPVRRLADGPPTELDGNLLPRDDGLRAFGNGVVPEQAYWAFIILWRHLT